MSHGKEVKKHTQLSLNKELAELLGWKNIVSTGGAFLGTPITGAHNSRGQAKVPDWTGNWDDCGKLLVEMPGFSTHHTSLSYFHKHNVAEGEPVTKEVLFRMFVVWMYILHIQKKEYLAEQALETTIE